MNKLWLIIILLGTVRLGFSQPGNDEQLAAHYYNSGDYEKAKLYYEKLYSANPSSTYYGNYFQTLSFLGEWDEAEKLVKRHLKRNSNQTSLYIDWGQALEGQGSNSKAEDKYQEALERSKARYSEIINVGKAFENIGRNDLALEAFLVGKESIPNYPFGIQLAQLYGRMNQREKMLNEYLEVVQKFPNYMVYVQNGLEAMLDFSDPNDKGVEQLRRILLEKTQKNPNDDNISQMFIWFLIQKQEFESALVQTKAMDKRRKGQGEDVIFLGRLTRNARVYDVAISAFQYVIDTYPKGYYSTNARVELLGTMYDNVVNNSYTQEDLIELEKAYELVLSDNEMGKNAKTTQLMLQLAHIEAFNMHNMPKAKALLNEILEMQGANKQDKAKAKMELGDIHLLAGEIWDASLYYKQVEFDFEQDILGHEAKFRNARIYYYAGQFEWAQSQLNALKTSTSKLIANDAIDLSLLITDNTGLDTSYKAMEMYAQADLMLYQNKFKEAEKYLDSAQQFSGSPMLADEVLYMRYKIAYKQQDFKLAAEHLKTIIEYYPEDILADNAIFKLAELFEFHFYDRELAADLYKQIMFDYESSIFVVEARKRFLEIRGSDPKTAPKIEKEEG